MYHAVPSPLGGLGNGSGGPLFDPVFTNRLAVLRLPDVGPQSVLVRLTGQEPIRHFLQIRVDV